MLDINFIKNNLDKVKEGVKNKGFESELVDRAVSINEQRIQLIGRVDRLRQERNNLQRDQVERGREIKEELRTLEPELDKSEKELKGLLSDIPNIPADDVPVGKDESENVVIRKWGELPKFDFQPKDHLELGEDLDVIDVERGAKVSGARFFYLKGAGAVLDFALARLAFDTLIEKGFVPIIPPVLIKAESMAEMGYLGSKEREDMYILDKDGLVLVGTSEQSIGPLHKSEVFEEKDLPKRYVGFSTCFRREAGSYGKDVKGIIRVHQFNKTEMFSYTKPEDSDGEHELLLSIEEELMQKLGLPYQVIKMCTGDLGITATRKYDIEAWFPAQNKYRETHSTSNVTDYQARGLNIKYKSTSGTSVPGEMVPGEGMPGKGSETRFVHTLNGTAFSQRPLICILENFQQKDGTVIIPEALRQYTGFSEIKPKG